MKKNKILIIEDIYLTQTYSGFLGKLFSSIYINILKFRIRIFIYFFIKENNFYVICPQVVGKKILKDNKFCYYDEKISEIDIGRYRQKCKKILEPVRKKIKKFCQTKGLSGLNSFDVWYTQAGIYLSWRIFPYEDIFNRLLDYHSPKEIWVLGKSKEESIASNLAAKRKIKVNRFYFLDLSPINIFIKKYLFIRQIKKKENEFFLSFKKMSRLNIKKFENSYILSVDFFRHLKILTPIYRKFKEKKEQICFVLDAKENFVKLNKLYDISCDHLYLSSFISLSREDIKKINLKKKYSIFWNKSEKDIFFLDPIKDYFEQLTKYALPLSEIYLSAADNLVKRLNPKGIICVNDTRMMENSLLLAAKNNRVFSAFTYLGCFLSLEKLNRYQGDIFFAIGNRVKTELQSINYPSEKIFVVGDPQFDFVSDKKHFSKDVLYKKLSIDIKKKIILLVSDRINPMLSYAEKRDQFKAVLKVIKNIKSVELVIKPHPTENRENLISDLKNWGMAGVTVSDNDKNELFEILTFTSVVIIGGSMVGFEAMLMQVPVIIANFANRDYNLQIPYVKEGGVLQVNNVRDLKNMINEVIGNKQLSQKQILKGNFFCRRYYRLPLGGASERIYQLIAKKNKKNDLSKNNPKGGY